MSKVDLSKSAQIIFFIIFLPIFSVGIVYAVSFIVKPLADTWYFPLIDSVGFIGAYILLFSYFNNIAWKYKIFRYLRIVSVPCIGGRWKGYIESSYDKKVVKIPAILEIDQTFSHIRTCLYTAQSFSSSLMADFVVAPNGRQELHYEYHNEPGENTPKTMHGHDGVAKLNFRKNKNSLTGTYYTTSQHDRGNIGTLVFVFESSKTCGCFDNS